MRGRYLGQSLAAGFLASSIVSCGIFRESEAEPGDEPEIRRGWVYPPTEGRNVDGERSFEWAWDGAPAEFRAEIVEDEGDQLIQKSAWSSEKKWQAPVDLPADRLLKARVYVRSNEEQELFESTFWAAFKITSPRHGEVLNEMPNHWTWTSLGVSYSFNVYLGTTRGGHDLLDIRGLQGASWDPAALSLPRDISLYLTVEGVDARGTVMRRADSVFVLSQDFLKAPSQITPRSTELRLSKKEIFEWSFDDRALQYAFRIARGKDLVWSAENLVSPYVWPPDLPPGDYDFEGVTEYAEGRRSVFWKIQVGSEFADDPGLRREAAFELSRRIHRMTMFYVQKHFPHTQSPLYWNVAGRRYVVNCSDYAGLLRVGLRNSNLVNGHANWVRIRHVGFLVNGTDGHTLTEFYDSESERWIYLDPTFALRIKDEIGRDLTRERFQRVVFQNEAAKLKYEMQESDSVDLLRGYYIDYPLLFLNLSPFSDATEARTEAEPFLERVPNGDGQRTGAYLVTSEEPLQLEIETDTGRRFISTEPHGRRAVSFVIWAKKISLLGARNADLFFLPRRLFGSGL